MGVASLVLGILAVLIGIFSSGVLGWLGAIMAIIGVVMGALGMKKPESKGIATAGLVVAVQSQWEQSLGEISGSSHRVHGPKTDGAVARPIRLRFQTSVKRELSTSSPGPGIGPPKVVPI